jgi:hypothetical protein
MYTLESTLARLKIEDRIREANQQRRSRGVRTGNTMPMRSSLSHAFLLGLGLCLLLTSCITTTKENQDRDEIQPLTRAQAETVLLTPQNLGPLYRQVALSDDDASDPGCFATLANSPKATTELERDFDRVGTHGLASIVSDVMSYPTTSAMTREFARVRRVLTTCKHIDDTSDGVRTRLKVSRDFEKSSPVADEQINISATGTFTSGGQRLPGGVWISLARIDNHAVEVGIFAADSRQSTDLPAYSKVAINRLAAVVAGKRPPPEKVPPPTHNDIVSEAQRLHLQPYFAAFDVNEIQNRPCQLLASQAIGLTKHDKVRPLRIRNTHLLADHRATVIPPGGGGSALIYSCGGTATWSDHIRDQVIIRLTLNARGQAFVDIEDSAA